MQQKRKLKRRIRNQLWNIIQIKEVLKKTLKWSKKLMIRYVIPVKEQLKIENWKVSETKIVSSIRWTGENQLTLMQVQATKHKKNQPRAGMLRAEIRAPKTEKKVGSTPIRRRLQAAPNLTSRRIQASCLPASSKRFWKLTESGVTTASKRLIS